MIARILSLLRRTLVRTRPAQPTANGPADPANNSSNPISLPRVQGSPEEELAMWDSPPVALARKGVITNVQPDGSLPETLEQIQLSPTGKVLARTNFVIKDDLGVLGKSGESPGQCQFCERYAFRAQPCGVCGLVACPGCGAPALIEGKPVFLCKPCDRAAKWQHDNWQR